MPKIALDAGHGLYTAGKQTPDGIKEWTLNDKVRDKVVDILKAYDVEIVNTDNDEGNKDESLDERVIKYYQAGADVFVSIHHNAYTGNWNTATGVEVFTDANYTSQDQKLAELIYDRMVKYIGLRGRGVKHVNFAVINQNRIPAVLCEGGFMDGSDDYKVITSEAGQKAYARAVAEGLIEFLDLKRKSATSTTTNKTTFQVKLLTNLNVRVGAGMDKAKAISNSIAKKDFIYTIVDTTTVNGVLWGKLKSGAGWICIDSKYCKRV